MGSKRCGFVYVSMSGVEWICVREPHGYSGLRVVARDGEIVGEPVKHVSARFQEHRMMVRFPYRPRDT